MTKMTIIYSADFFMQIDVDDGRARTKWAWASDEEENTVKTTTTADATSQRRLGRPLVNELASITEVCNQPTSNKLNNLNPHSSTPLYRLLK